MKFTMKDMKAKTVLSFMVEKSIGVPNYKNQSITKIGKQQLPR